MRKKAVQNLDSRQKTMIDNAFYYTNPPERQKVILCIFFNALNQFKFRVITPIIFAVSRSMRVWLRAMNSYFPKQHLYPPPRTHTHTRSLTVFSLINSKQ